MLTVLFSCVHVSVRKGLLDYREENITIDRACRQETFAYEMVSLTFPSLSAMRP